MPYLIIEKGADKGTSKKIPESGEVIVGRSSEADFTVNELMISREHFRIVDEDGEHRIEDLDSVHGTFIDGERISEKTLEFGDQIQVGETLFSFLSEETREEKKNLIGETIGGYQIQERIGRGGMGTVYKARQIRLNRDVAFKILSKDLIQDKKFVGLFIKEARSAANLNHPNIVQVYDVARQRGLYYISMEYVPGGSVQDLLSSEGQIEPLRAARMIKDAARGLEYAQKKGLVHRDIKPDNLMIAEDEVVKIIDLGLARKVREQDIEEDETVFGTPHYMPPERVLQQDMDHRGDIYSLGATFYRMVVGDTPFEGNSIKEILRRKVNDPPPDPSETVDDLPSWISSEVQRMMQPDPKDRPPSATEVAERLEEGIRSETDTMRVDSLTEEEEEQTSVAMYMVAGFLLLLMASGLFVMLNATGTGNTPNADGNNTKDLPTATPPGNSSPPETPPKKNEEEWLPVLKKRFRNVRNSNNLEQINTVIDYHKLFLASFPESGNQELVEDQLDTLRSRKNTLLFRNKFQPIKDRITQTRKNHENAVLVEPEKVNQAKTRLIQSIRDIYDRVNSSRFEFNPRIRKKLNRQVQKLSRWYSNERYRLHRFRDELVKCHSELADNNFDSAILRTRRLRNKEMFSRPPYQQSLSVVIDRIQENEKQFFESRREEIQKLLAEKKFEKATRQAEKIQSVVATESISRETRNLLHKINRARQEHKTLVRRKKRKAERSKLGKAGARFFLHADSRRIQLDKNPIKELSPPTFSQNKLSYKLLLFLSKQYTRFFQRLINKINKITNSDKRENPVIKHPEYNEVTITEIDQTHINFRVVIDGEPVQSAARYSSFPISEILKLATSSWEPFTYRDRVRTSVMYYFYHHRNSDFRETSISYMKQARNLAKRNRDSISMSEIEQSYLKLIRGKYQSFRETISAGLFNLSNELLNNGKEDEAKQALSLMEIRFSGTAFFRNTIDRIQQARENAGLPPVSKRKWASGKNDQYEQTLDKKWRSVIQPVKSEFESGILPRIEDVLGSLIERGEHGKAGTLLFNLDRYKKACEQFRKHEKNRENIPVSLLYRHLRAVDLAEQPASRRKSVIQKIKRQIGSRNEVLNRYRKWKKSLPSTRYDERQMKETYLLNRSNPETLIQMVKSLYNVRLPSARKRYIIAVYLLQNHSDHEFVTSGDCRLAAATSLQAMGAFQEAISHYKKVLENSRDRGRPRIHPPIPERINTCEEALDRHDLK